MKYIPPRIETLKPLPDQQVIIDKVLALIEDEPVFDTGRGSGKSTLRGFIAAAVLDEPWPSYRVEPVAYEYGDE